MRGLPGYVMVLRHIIWEADFLTRGEMMGRRCPALWRAKQGHDFLLHGTRYLDLYRLQVQLKFRLVRFKKRNSDTNYTVCLGATVPDTSCTMLNLGCSRAFGETEDTMRATSS